MHLGAHLLLNTFLGYIGVQVSVMRGHPCRGGRRLAPPACDFTRMPRDLSQTPSAALLTSPHLGAQEVEGVLPSWRGWTLLRAMTWFVAHPRICRHGPAASQATGNHLIWDESALLVCQRELLTVTPSKTFLLGLDSETSLWYLRG